MYTETLYPKSESMQSSQESSVLSAVVLVCTSCAVAIVAVYALHIGNILRPGDLEVGSVCAVLSEVFALRAAVMSRRTVRCVAVCVLVAALLTVAMYVAFGVGLLLRP